MGTKRIKQLFSTFAILVSHPCLLVTALSPHNIRVLWHLLTHGGWSTIQDELSVYEQESPASPKIPLRHDTLPRQTSGVMLVIDRSLPRFDRDAGSRACWQYIQLSLSMGLRVIVWGHDFLRPEPYASMLEEMGAEVISGRKFTCGGWKKWIKANANAIDYVVIHRPNIAVRYIDYLKRNTHARIFYFGHDLRWLRNARRYKLEKDRFFLSESIYWKKIETRLVQQVDASYYFSTVESEEMNRLCPFSTIRVVPLFMVEEEPARVVPPYNEREGLLFVGGFSHAPNVDGVLWFVDEILPELRRQLGPITLTVVGKNPPEKLIGMTGVELVGAVSEAELMRLYDHARVVVAPLRYGAGIKGKVVEAICRKLPTVTTPIGAEGLPAAASVLQIAENPEQFCKLVSKLYSDPTLWSQKSIGMSNYMVEHFSSSFARSMLENELKPHQPVNDHV
jgi:glycosyltransferase involved in cell wall biosynthesis